MGSADMNAWQLLLKGGPVMWPILLCSVTVLSIFAEKLFYFSSISTNLADLKDKVFLFVKQNKVKDAIIVCEQSNSPVAKIMKAGIVKYGASRDEVKEAMQEISLFEIPRLEKRMHALATLAHTSLLLGLLGTVVGMANVFHAIEVRSVSMSPVTPGDLAGGIWQALFTTIFGLCVAIGAFLAYNYCMSWINNFVVSMEKAATELVNILSHLSDVREPAGEDS